MAAITRAAHDAGRADRLGPLAQRRRGRGRARRAAAPTSPSAAPTSTSAAARARRPSSTCAPSLQEALRQPIWGWLGRRDPFADGARLRAGRGDPGVPLRHAAGPRAACVAAGPRAGRRAPGIEPIRAKGIALTELAIALADALARAARRERRLTPRGRAPRRARRARSTPRRQRCASVWAPAACSSTTAPPMSCGSASRRSARASSRSGTASRRCASCSPPAEGCARGPAARRGAG